MIFIASRTQIAVNCLPFNQIIGRLARDTRVLKFINIEKCGQVYLSLNPLSFKIIDHFILISYGLLWTTRMTNMIISDRKNRLSRIQKVTTPFLDKNVIYHMGRAKRICYLSPMRAAKVQASLRIRAVSPEPPLLAHTSSESRGTFRQKARSIAPLNGWACAVEICHDGMLEDTNSLDAAHMTSRLRMYM